MLVEVKIKDISLFEKSSYKIKKVYNNEKVLIDDNFTQKIKTFHDSIFSYLKIVLEKESILSSTVGFVEIRLRDLRNQEKSFCIYDGKYEQDFHSYPFVSKQVVGNMILQFKITEEEFEETHRNNQPSFLDRIFHDIFNVEKDTKFSLILARMISFSTANASSYFNSTKGFYFLLNFYSAEEKKFSFSKIVDFLNSLKKNESISLSFLNDGIDSKIEEVRNNCELCDNEFYLKYKKILLYAISSYGNSIITNSLKSRKIKEKLEMKDYLEYLGDNVSEIKFYNVVGTNYLPIFIAFDDKESFVISFRGTFSVRDTICDLKFEYKEFYEGFSHEGFTELAEEFLKKYTQNILENIKSKKLIITGHSLGGSIAHLVGYLLLKRNLVKKEDLEVITFSSAPILSKNIVEKDLFENFITFTLSNDSVPFLSYGSICDLRYLTTSLGVKLNLFTTTYSEIRDLIYTIKEYLIQTDLHPKLYIPGKIFQFKEYKDNSKSRFHKLFKLLQKDRKEIKVFLCKETDYTFCNEIILDLNSAMYHMPGSLMNVFDESIRLNKFIEVRENQNVL